mgnify:FL=1
MTAPALSTAAPVLTFSEADHVYRLDGAIVPSVTQVPSLAGLVDLSQIDPARLAAASRRGTAVHLATEYDDTGDLDEASVTDEVRPYLMAWRRFRADSGIVLELIEERVAHVGHRFAGTIDRVGRIKGRREIVDLKSGTTQPTHGLQLAAYDLALPEDDEPRGRLTVQLRRDGTYRVHRYDNPHDRATFLACVRVAHWKLAHLRTAA